MYQIFQLAKVWTVKTRTATITDIPAITAIYNEAIQHTLATFDTTQKTPEEMKVWLRHHGPKNPCMVGEHEGSIIGWAALSQWSDRCAYDDTAEVSVYITEPYRGKGFGKQLFHDILVAGKKAGIHAVIARITEGNKISINLHKKEGFFPVGIMKEVGLKFGKRLDVHLMQLIYDE